MPEHGAVAAKRGHNVGGQPDEKNVFFFVSNTSVPYRLSVRTKSVVETHERSVLRQFELCRDESEARGDEEREHRCGLSVDCQTALHFKRKCLMMNTPRR
jgi:hypothetical protein